MARGLKILFLGLSITAIVSFSAGAQENPSNENPNRAQIQQLRQNIQALRQQCEPIRAQIKGLEAQIRTLREQLHPIDEQLKADYEQLQALRGREHHKHWENHQGGQGQGEWQRPSGPITNSETN